MHVEHSLAFDQFVLDQVSGELYGRTGAVPLTPRALAMLEQNLPIRVRRTLPWWTTVEAR